MSHSRLVSRLFEIDGSSLTMMGLQGSKYGKNWIIGIPFSSNSDYILVEVTPEPISPSVLKVIEDDRENGDFEKIKYLLISNRVAVLLWLEGVLSRKDFENVVEGKAIVPDSDFLILNQVELEGNNYQVIILPETVSHRTMIATLDQSLRVVGSDESQGPILDLNGSTNLVS